jgi:hypothetical protein
VNLKRLKSISAALSFGLVLVCSQSAQAIDCGTFLSRAVQATSRLLSLGAQVPASYRGDYKPAEYDQLSLSERFITTYKRIQDRQHHSVSQVFFYDYEVKDVIAKMAEVLSDARDFSKTKSDEGQRYFKAYQQLQVDLALYQTQSRISYEKFHETTLLFAAFQKKGLKSTPPFERRPQGRYSVGGYKFTIKETQHRIETSGFQDSDYETDWQARRARMLRKAPRAIFIPTFEELDEDFFNGISSYPVYPAGLTTNPHIIVDGQVFGPVLFLLHDFYHGKKSWDSISYSTEDIQARELRRMAFNESVAAVTDSLLNRLIRVMFNFVTHEEHRVFIGDTIVLSRSKDIVSALILDAPRVGGGDAIYDGSDENMFEEIQTRIYDRPHDFGEMFGDAPPPSHTLFEARQWLSNFFRNDTYYP